MRAAKLCVLFEVGGKAAVAPVLTSVQMSTESRSTALRVRI
ncbi:MAG: hypothetical protein OJF48_001747 [Afipia sp.]|nr:MAG: hypothetical protein OJF48_001747 [Afipia sp.]